ncbi:hypothetical protein LSAT2_026024 [Lamellibrachia satsuma]|nr:hypothetical protein LSAT2_026024 [Lamellibrachia satsuma]
MSPHPWRIRAPRVLPGSPAFNRLSYWPFGLVICDLWQVLDVTLCTSSIMHMCAISIDRYVGIRDPLKTRGKTIRVAVYKMAAVWCISLVTASPIILLSVLKPEAVLAVDDQQRYQCAITSRYFLSYGSLTAFFIPFVHHVVRLLPHYPPTQTSGTTRDPSLPKPPSETAEVDRRETREQCSSENVFGRSTLSGSFVVQRARRDTPVATWLTSGDSDATPSGECTSKRDNNLYADVAVVSRGTSPCRGGSDNEIMHPGVTETSPSSPEDNSAAAKPILGSMTSPTTTIQRRSNDLPRPALPAGGVRGKVKLRDVVRKHSVAITAAGILIQNQDICRRRESSVRTERKAVKVLGMMFAIFVFCWTPFFSLNFTMGVCDTCHIDAVVFKVCLWLGYVSSTLNPIVYTVFNRTFKVSFTKLVTCRYGYFIENRRSTVTSFGWTERSIPLKKNRRAAKCLIETHV